jgi:unsaturated rhamnogalacturonyl hydrolase
MKAISIFLLILMSLSVSAQSSEDARVIVSIKRNYKAPNVEKTIVYLDWKELSGPLSALKASNIDIVDQHFGEQVNGQIIDSNSDGKPEGVRVDFTFKSNEPVFALKVSAKGKGLPVTVEGITKDPRFEIGYLVPYAYSAASKSKKSIAEKIVESTLNTYPDPKDLSIISPGKWTYEYGFFLNGTYRLYQQTKNERYFNYMKKWMDGYLNDDGTFKEGVYNRKEYRLDDVLPGRLCIYLFQQTGDLKYKKVADQFIEHLTQQPKTKEGGYWHKEIYPYQMWLDGIYMGDVFSMQYAAAFNMPHWFDEAILQINLMYKHAVDPVSGLLYHGWDESKNDVWANNERGTSPELWARAIGWYAMALIECLDYLPASHPERQNVESIFRKLCASIKNFQDQKTGLWYQVINKGKEEDNWIETSSSSMFCYAFAKGFNKKLLDKSYHDASEKAFSSIIGKYIYVDASGDIHLDQGVKVGSLNIKNSKGDYPYYITSERRLDDYKGLAALLYSSIELKK